MSREKQELDEQGAEKSTPNPQHDWVIRRHAWDRSSATGYVQLLVAGAEGAEGPSPAGSAGHDRRDSALDITALRCHVCRARSAVDSTGEAAAGAIVADALLGAQRAVEGFWPKDGKRGAPPDNPGNPTADFHGQKRCNETHESTTDPDAKLARKGAGKEAQLSYSGNLLVENRKGLIVNAELLEANGRAERDAALLMLERVPGHERITVGGDKGFDTREFAAECRHMNVTPHVAQNTARADGSAIDARTTRHAGYAVSQKRRKRIEERFGWMKDIALIRKLKHRGVLR